MVFKAKTFWLVAAIVAVIIFVAGINMNRTNQSEMDVLILPQSDAMARNAQQILANAKQIPLSLSFYDKLIERNSDIEDGAAGLPDNKRKQFWNSQIRIEQVRKSGVLKIKIFNANQWQAEILNRQVAADLAIVMSKYYNIKTDLDIRIIDGPIASSAVKMNFIVWTIFALIFGLAVGAIISFLAGWMPRKSLSLPKAAGKKLFFKQKPSIFPKFSFPVMERKKPETKADQKNFFDFAAEEKSQAGPILLPGKKSAAPANLPIAEDITIESLAEAEKEKRDAAAHQDKTREATAEEVKERLNKLLGGYKIK